ncbi:MAG: hypothetical protein ACC662_00710, partial [Planctomycetota bacterium]
MRRPLPVVAGVLLAALLGGLPRQIPSARADDVDPEVVVHVPIDQMDVLLEADRRGIVLDHAAYQRLLAAARARASADEARPPVDAALLAAEGVLDLTESAAAPPRGAPFSITWRVRVLADGPSLVDFPWRGAAVETIDVEGEGQYEERAGRGRLRFEGRGGLTVTVTGFAAVERTEARRRIDLVLPPSGAMAIRLRLPAAVTGFVEGEGGLQRFETAAREASERLVRPRRDGRLSVVWGPAARSADLPPVLDVETRTLHTIDEGMIRSRILVHVEVFREGVETLRLRLPARSGIRAAGGKDVVATARSADRRHLLVTFAKPVRGAVEITLDVETPYRPRAGVPLPRVAVEGALRERGRVDLRFGRGVEARAVHVRGGRRLVAGKRKQGDVVLEYALDGGDGGIDVDLEPARTRLEATSTYYLNLTEPAKTLLAAITLHVFDAPAFVLRPRFPPGYVLRSLTIDGRSDGFRRDPRPDGTIEIRLERGIPAGGSVAILATLERAAVDWVPETGAADVPFVVPSASAAREEGWVAVGADASFQVLDRDVKDLVPVGAAELTSRGVSPVGLVYGYRLDGPAPLVRLSVTRRAPRMEATVVTLLEPQPRRLELSSTVIHRIERAGVRRLIVDLPAWARDTVRFEAGDLLSSERLEEAEGVPEGFERWAVRLARRVLGRHVLHVRYFLDQPEENWRVPATQVLVPRVPLDTVARRAVVLRAPGLEVEVDAAASTMDLADLPSEAVGNPRAVLEVLRLAGDREGPGIAVEKHSGAAVLDAIATEVSLDTAVASAGILRTRARVQLVNVGQQFLHVALPAGSDLIGAVIDGESVKPLRGQDGVLRIPIPAGRRGRRDLVADLTYETRLGGPLGGRARIPAPTFPGLEVLRTTQRLAFDPSLAIERVSGDYGATLRRPSPPRPWIARLLEVLVSRGEEAASRSRPVGQDAPGLETMGE